MSEAKHSKWSASGFEQRMLCAGSHVMQHGAPRRSSKYSAEGTAAHQLLTWALQQNLPAAHFMGTAIEADGFTFVVDDDMARHVQVCIDYVVEVAGETGVILVDVRVNYSTYLDVPQADAWGTADVIILLGDEIIVIDFKYGQGVEVSSGSDLIITQADGSQVLKARKPNPQMALYALGALQAYQDIMGEFTNVRLVISQPRIRQAPSEYDLPVGELESWARSTARSAVVSCQNAMAIGRGDVNWAAAFLSPGEKQCKFCSGKAACPAVRDEVAATVFGAVAATPDEFAEGEPLDAKAPAGEPNDATLPAWLAACMSKADLIEDWVKAIRAEVEAQLLAGKTIPGYKIVQGKRGARQWADDTEAEKLLKSMRLKEDQLYDFKLKSAPQIAKLGPALDKEGKPKPPKEGEEKPVIGVRQWPKVAALIVQRDGKPHVAPADDPRPALTFTPTVDDFEDVAPAPTPSAFDDLA